MDTASLRTAAGRWSLTKSDDMYRHVRRPHNPIFKTDPAILPEKLFQ